MAEGFLSEGEGEGTSTDKTEMETLGGAYFKDLVARKTFQRSFLDKSRFVMHELFHELAELAAGGICFRMECNRQMQMSKLIRCLSYDSSLSNEFKNLNFITNLRTFMPSIPPPPHDTYRCIPDDILLHLLPKLKSARVLSLREFSMLKLPDSIGKLRHLRYLDLSHAKIKSLPDSICGLDHLQTLLLSKCRNLEKLPSKIGNLINLRHLDITEAFFLRGMPIQIGELTNLQTLSIFVLAPGPGDGCGIRSLKNLSKLKGDLSIYGLENIITTQDALEARLSDKLGLTRLKLKWNKNFSLGVDQKEVLDMLQPPNGLEELIIDGYDATLFPDSIGDPSFTSLQFLELKNCKRCTTLPSIRRLPQLKSLCIRGCNSVNYVGIEFYGENKSNAFLSLETLCFEDMPEWTEWNPCEVDEAIGHFPCLGELSIISCPKLSGTLPSHLPGLKKLLIRGCEKLKFSVSTFRQLHELEIDGCKNLVQGSPFMSGLMEQVSVSSILDLTCFTERMLLWFSNAKSLKIDGCKDLISLLPKKQQLLAQMRSLDVLKISNCSKLVPLEAEDEEQLQEVEAEDEEQLQEVEAEDEEQLQKVGIPKRFNYLNLSLEGSETVKKIPKVSRVFSSLKELTIERCPKLVSFSEVCFPSTLKRLEILHCENLKYLLQDKGKYVYINKNYLLEHLEIKWCPSLVSLSSSTKLSVRLNNQKTDRGSNSAPALSSCGQLLAGIKQVRISYCHGLLFVNGELPSRLQRLQVWHCSKLKALSHNIMLPEELKSLQIGNCPSLTSIALANIHDNSPLQYIGVLGCDNIQVLPEGLDKLRNLREIELVYCKNLKSFPESRLSSPNLKVLRIEDCENLQTLHNNFQNLTSLEKLELSSSWLPEKGFPVNLKSLSVTFQRKEEEEKSLPKKGCPVNLKSLSVKKEESLSVSKRKTDQKSFKEWELHKLTSLEQLMIEGGCPKNEPDQELEMILPTSLVELTVKDFQSLKSLSLKNFENIISLKYLSIIDCPKVMSLPKKNSLRLLSRLHIDACPLLRTRCLPSGEEWHKIAHIPYVRIDDKLLSEED